MKTVSLKVDYLTRVEGEGSLHVKMKNGAVEDVQLRIFEPPRFFEAFLRGRSSVHAIENAFGLSISGPLRELRRLVYCGEWIESHTLHVYMLHAPDFLGYPSAIEMAKDQPEALNRGLQLKKVGNEIVALLGGREIHPINVRVGGFYRIPAKRDLARVAERLKWAREAALETVRWVSAFEFPDFERDYEFVALLHPNEYPLNEGRLASNKGLDIEVSSYDAQFAEEHVRHSTALHSARVHGGSYCVGPLARFNLNFERLSPVAREAAQAAGIRPPCHNPFRSIIVRAVEILHSCEEALRLIENFEMPEKPAVGVQIREGVGFACTEAPRGILYNRYRTDAQGSILDAKIVPPTAQNQKTIEEDLRQFIPKYSNLPKNKLTEYCERVIRNHDPCISCSTHLLRNFGEKASSGMYAEDAGPPPGAGRRGPY
jgi:coenzyme F420-reducing hydrogenase alpha subunit